MSKVLKNATIRKVRVAYVTNGPAPYRIELWNRLACDPSIELKIFFAVEREPNRQWDLAPMTFEHEYLRQACLTWHGRFIHTNPDVWQRLKAFAPQVVVTTGFNPTHLMAFAFARAHGCKHVAMTDGTLQSEAGLSALHRVVRRHVYAHSEAYAGPCEGTFELYRSYGISDAHMFKSHLVADNAAFAEARHMAKRLDFIFCGRLSEVKNPLFALEVAAETALRIGRRVSISFVGSGEMEAAVRARAADLADQVQAEFPGFAKQAELPSRYGEGRIFLFPTLWDPWGVVANEASAAGLPTLVSHHAGSANELIRNGRNGYVMDLDTSRWAEAAARLLTDDGLWNRMSQAACAAVDEYTASNAALGLAAAIRHAAGVAQAAWNPLVLPASRRLGEGMPVRPATAAAGPRRRWTDHVATPVAETAPMA